MANGALWSKGQFLSCFCIASVVAVLFTAGTLSRFHKNSNLRRDYISDMHSAYDTTVESWTSDNRHIMDTKLSQVAVYSTDQPTSVIPLTRTSDKDMDIQYEDAPQYDPLHWQLGHLTLDRLLADPDVHIGTKYTVVVNGTLNGVPILNLSTRLPFVKVVETTVTQYECCKANGLWRDSGVCQTYALLDNICFGVKYTTGGGVEQWEVEDGDEGCYPSRGPDGASVAHYMQVPVGDLLGASYPSLPQATIEVRSNDDPFLVAIDVTDGTLMFDQVPPYSERYWEIVRNARMGVVYGVVGGVALVFMLIMWTNRGEMIDDRDDAGYSQDAARNKRFRRGPESLGLKKNRAEPGSYQPLEGDYRPPAAI